MCAEPEQKAEVTPERDAEKGKQIASEEEDDKMLPEPPVQENLQEIVNSNNLILRQLRDRSSVRLAIVLAGRDEENCVLTLDRQDMESMLNFTTTMQGDTLIHALLWYASSTI